MSENNLKAYIEQALKIRQTQDSVSNEEMQKIALSLGLSQEDLAKVEDVFKGAVLRGQGFMKFQDYESAIKEFEYAAVLKPNNAEVLQSLAYCYTHFAVINEDKKIYQKAQETIKNALLIDPSHQQSYAISSELNRGLKNISLKNLQVSSSNSYNNKPASIRPRMFAKSRKDNKLAGVLGGIANYFGMGSLALRAIVVVGAMFTGIFPLLFLYALMAMVMKKEPLDDDY